MSHFIINNFILDDTIAGSPSFHQTGTMFKSGCISENIIATIGAIIGEPYSIHFEGKELINNLTPQRETKTQYTGLGSDVELDLHIENSALRFMGDDDCSPLGLLLLGVREQTEFTPCTNIVDFRLVLNEITKQDISILRGDNYIIKVPYRWRSAFAGDKVNTQPCPMITGHGNQIRISAVFYPDMVTALSNEAKIALEHLYNALRSKLIKVNITPGKLVYIDNRITLHSRDKFIAQYDVNNNPYRWIQRLFVMPNLWPMQNYFQVGTRVFDPSYNTTQNQITPLGISALNHESLQHCD